MVKWGIGPRSGRPNSDPWATVEVSFPDGSTIVMVYRGARDEGEGPRRRYAYTVCQPTIPRTVTAGMVRSGVGARIDHTAALEVLVSFLSADADRFEYAQRHGGAHPDGQPVEPICRWAAGHRAELDQLALDLDDRFDSPRPATA